MSVLLRSKLEECKPKFNFPSHSTFSLFIIYMLSELMFDFFFSVIFKGAKDCREILLRLVSIALHSDCGVPSQNFGKTSM